jgi:hypothetical protein
LKYINDNAKIVGAGEIPQVPMLLFISNDPSTTELTNATRMYANTVENAKVIQLDCPHYVHDYEYNIGRAAEIKQKKDGTAKLRCRLMY